MKTIHRYYLFFKVINYLSIIPCIIFSFAGLGLSATFCDGQASSGLPDPSSSKQAKAFLMTSSGSVPLSRSPNMVRNMVKLMGPGASLIMASR